MYSWDIYAQDFAVTGVVSDVKGELLSGVSVVIKGTSKGTTTDVNGKYFLSVNDNSTLVFSFIGMKTEEIKVGGRKLINVKMEDDTKLL